MAEQVRWREPDGYLRFCQKILKASRPRNSREVTKVRLALESMIPNKETSMRTRLPIGEEIHIG